MSVHSVEGGKQRAVLGGIGILASLVFLVASMAMNWRFGYSLGKTELDGYIYGAISAAADAFKALCPFFFFAALRTRNWAAAFASALVWVIVVVYASAGAAGHAGANRLDTTGARTLAADHYKDLRADLKRNQDQLSWLPPHRDAGTVQGELDSAKAKNLLLWNYSAECTEPNGKQQREFCAAHGKLNAELASAKSAARFNAKIDEISGKLADTKSGAAVSDADPQATIISRMLAYVGLNLGVADTQTWLAIAVALVLEIGSTFGLYISVLYLKGAAEQAANPTIIDARAREVSSTPLVTEPARDAALGLPPPSQPVTGAEIIPAEPQPTEPAPVSPAHVARLPLPGSLPSLDAIGFPIHSRPLKRRDPSKPDDAAKRFVTWLRAFDLVREPLTNEEITAYYAEFCEADYRAPTAENLLLGDLKHVKGVEWSKPRTPGDDGKVKRQARWEITRGKYPPPTASKQEGVVLAYPRPLAGPAREPEMTMRRAA